MFERYQPSPLFASFSLQATSLSAITNRCDQSQRSTMKFLSILALAGSLANALPVESAATGEMIEWASEADARMTESLLVRTDLETGSSSKCPKAILIYARGSTEPGNMVRKRAAVKVDYLCADL